MDRHCKLICFIIDLMLDSKDSGFLTEEYNTSKPLFVVILFPWIGIGRNTLNLHIIDSEIVSHPDSSLISSQSGYPSQDTHAHTPMSFYLSLSLPLLNLIPICLALYAVIHAMPYQRCDQHRYRDVHWTWARESELARGERGMREGQKRE